MDKRQFDALTQALTAGATRRTVGRLLAGSALAGVAGWLGLSEASEAKRKRKKRKKNRCPGSLPKVCPPTPRDPHGLCVPSGFTCCSDALGGGACAPETPRCCPPGPGWPDGFCAPFGFDCLLGYFSGSTSNGPNDRLPSVTRRLSAVR
jgi:hypothetical protein